MGKSLETCSCWLNEKLELRKVISKGVNARRRRGKKIVYKENEEYRGDDAALRYRIAGKGIRS